jgi:hypothetical protein
MLNFWCGVSSDMFPKLMMVAEVKALNEMGRRMDKSSDMQRTKSNSACSTTQHGNMSARMRNKLVKMAEGMCQLGR